MTGCAGNGYCLPEGYRVVGEESVSVIEAENAHLRKALKDVIVTLSADGEDSAALRFRALRVAKLALKGMPRDYALHVEALSRPAPSHEGVPWPDHCRFCGRFTTEATGLHYDSRYGVLCRNCHRGSNLDGAKVK